MSDTVAHGAIPAIDLEPFATGADAQSPQARDTAARLDVVLRDVGFLTVVGHGVSTEVRQAFFDMIRRFFDQPEAKKQEIAISNSPYHRATAALLQKLSKAPSERKTKTRSAHFSLAI